MEYVISLNGRNLLGIGNWVKLFRVLDENGRLTPIRLQIMRVEEKLLVFEFKDLDQRGSKAVLPHVGEVVSIERRSDEIRFKVQGL